MRYFHVRGRHSRQAAVIAAGPGVVDLDLWADLEGRRSADGWAPPPASAGDLVDWPPSDLLPRLCSARLRRVLSGLADGLVWLPVVVEAAAGPADLAILHFQDFADPVDPARSVYAGGRLLRAHLSAAKVAGRRVFALHPLSPSVVVDAAVREALTEARCTGIEFEHCPCS